MSKQVKRQKGDIGKPLAGQKRDLGKRLAGQKRDLGKGLTLNEGENVKRVALGGAGEMVAGRMATRSVTRDLSNVDCMGKQPGLTNTEKELEEGEKAVNGEEGNLGKPLARQKRDLGKRFALNEGERVKRVALEKKLRGAGKMVAGCRATRPVERMRKQPGYISVSEHVKMKGATFSKDRYKGRRPLACLTKTEKESKEGEKAKGSLDLSSSEWDEMANMFFEWAKKYNRKYESEEEEEKRFMIWLSTKNFMDERHSHRPGYMFSLDYMNFFADMTLSERVMMPWFLCEEDLYKGRCEVDPYEGPSPTLKSLSKTKEGLEEVGKTRIEFNKWAARHKRNYGSKEEREERFSAYLENKRRIDLDRKLNPGYWIYGYDLENMDKFPWEASLIPWLR